MRFLLEDTLLLIIDFQEKLIPAIYEHEKMIANSCILIKGIKLLEIPFMITQQNTKGLGKTIKEIIEITDTETIFEKMTFSTYANVQIKNEVYRSGKKNIILCGTEVHICVLQTLIDLCNDGYHVALVEDCIGSRKESDKDIQEGAFVVTYESILESGNIKIGSYGHTNNKIKNKRLLVCVCVKNVKVKI